MELCPREKGGALPVAAGREGGWGGDPGVHWKPQRGPCSAVGLSFHIYEKLRLCIHGGGKEGSVSLQQCQQSCRRGKDPLRRTFPRAAGSLAGEPRAHV